MTLTPPHGDESSPPVSRAPVKAVTEDPPGSGRWRLLVIGAVAVLAVLGVVYVVALLVVGDNVPRGTSVAGVDIGGLTSTDAVDRLESELASKSREVVVSLDGETRSVRATRSGLAFDAESTVSDIDGRSYWPWVLVGQVGSQEVPPSVDVSDRRLKKTVASLARRVDDAVREGVVRYEGLEIVATQPRTGLALDRVAAFDAVVTGYLVAEEPIELPVGLVAPEVSAEQVQDVAEGAAVEAISAPVTFTIEGQAVTVTPEEIAAALSFRPADGELRPVVDAPGLRDGMAEELGDIGRLPRDASFDVSSGKPVVVPARQGRGVTDQSISEALVAAIASTDRTAVLSLERITPDLTTASAKDLGVKQVISTFTQEFPYAAYRVTNIGVAARSINGTVLEPGETFSLNEVVGERTPENGFVKGYIIVGNRLVEDYGGAVSTITTATWHTAFFAGMTRVEQRAHGFWISRYLPGLEATVSWGNLDLEFRNDTPYGVFITASVTDTSVTVTMWSTKYWDIEAEFGPRTNPRPAGTVYDDAEGCVAQYGVDGFDITVTRVWKRGGEVKRREPLDTSYSAAPTVICEPEPAPSPTSTPTERNPSDKPKPTGSGGGGSGGGGSGGGGSGGGGSG